MAGNMNSLGNRRVIDLTVDELVTVIAERLAGVLPAQGQSDPMIPTKEMAAILKKHSDTLRRWFKSDPDCPAIRVGDRDLLWPQQETIEWLRGRQRG